MSYSEYTHTPPPLVCTHSHINTCHLLPHYSTQYTAGMSDIKLTYFDLKGRAEISRFILSYSGARFTDERLTGEQFGALKSRLAYGQMPVLNYKGQTLYQSITIAR